MLVQSLLWNGLALHQHLVALQVLLGRRQLRLVFRLLCDRLVQRRLQRAGIDLSKGVACSNVLALYEVDGR